MSENAVKLLKQIGFSVEETNLIEKALTHSSYSKDNNLGYLENNERLEFLGDAVLKLSCSEFLYKKYPNSREGELSKIRSVMVSDANLFGFAEQFDLPKYLNIGIHEEKSGGRERQSTVACAFEALLGALYLQTSYEEVYKFLLQFFEKNVEYVKNNIQKINAKATLQEFTQGQSKDLPEYVKIETIGKEHDKTFVYGVSYHGKLIATGTGKSKKEAEQSAAYSACLKLGVLNE